MRIFEVWVRNRKPARWPSRLVRIGILWGIMAVIQVPPASAQLRERSLTLQECIQMALRNNLDLRVSRYNPEIAETDVELERSAFSPRITSGTEFRDSTNPVFIPFTLKALEVRSESVGWQDRLGTGFDYSIDFSTSRSLAVLADTDLSDDPLEPVYQTSLLFNFTQPLLRNRGVMINRTQIRVAKNNRRISDNQYRQSVLDTLKAVEEAYWELVFAQRDLEVRRQSLRRAERFLEENRVKVEVGTLAPIEITTAEAEVASREEDVIVGENAVGDAEDILRVLLVSTEHPLWEERILPADRPPFREVEVDMEESIGKALENRPDLEQQRLSVENEETARRFRRNQRLYGLDFVGSYGAEGLIDTRSFFDQAQTIPNPQAGQGIVETWEQVGGANFDSWSIGLNLSIPISNRAAKSQYTAARLRKEQAVVNYELLRQEAIQEVRSSVRQIETDLKRVKAAQVNKKLQREKLEGEEKKYENGMSTSFQVLEFQEDLAEAERGEIRAIIDYNLSQAELGKVTGTLAENWGVQVE